MKNFSLKIFLISTLLVMSVGAFSQSIDALKAEIKRAEEEIRINNELLAKTRKDQKVSQSQLKMIQSRIDNRKKIISSLEKQITLINKDISTKNTQVNGLSNDLSKLKKDYGAMLYTAYKNYKLNNFLVFIFASKDFNDMTRRVSFMRRYNRMREQKADQIKNLTKQIGTQISELDSKLAELDVTKSSKSKEVETMAKDESQYKSAVASLKSTESKLSTTVKAKQAQINKAMQQIQRIIADEARKSKAKPKSTAEEQYRIELSGKFDQNMGKLPYPVRGGVIIDNFGVHAHPTQKGMTVNNPGVNIAAEPGAEVRCVFEGVVTHISFNDWFKNIIIVRHGSYSSVYSNIASVSVKKGDKVAINQVLGRIASDGETDEFMVNFQIWKETTNLNPAIWLHR